MEEEMLQNLKKLLEDYKNSEKGKKEEKIKKMKEEISKYKITIQGDGEHNMLEVSGNGISICYGLSKIVKNLLENDFPLSHIKASVEAGIKMYERQEEDNE